MKIISESCLERFRRAPRCEWCGEPSQGRLDPHHCSPRGMGGGKRVDHAINLLAVCRVPCHGAAEASREWTRELIARREGVTVGEILDLMAWVRRTPKEAAHFWQEASAPMTLCGNESLDSRLTLLEAEVRCPLCLWELARRDRVDVCKTEVPF